METKLIAKYPINPKRKTHFSGSWRFINLSILLTTVIFLFSACNAPQQASQVIIQSEEDTIQQLPEGQGLAIGAVAPEFSLPDAKGNTHSLSEYSGQKLIIVFYRTGTWGFCQTQLGELQEGYQDIQAQGAELIAISADHLTLVDSTQQALQITYLLLSDEDTETITAYNVIDITNTDIARPATYVLDTDGRVVWKFLDPKFDTRVSSDQILTELKKL